MVCPCCNSPLELENARLSNRYVYAGKLSCSCGYHIAIRNGVVVTGNCYTGCYDHPDLSFGGCYEGVGEHFVTNFQKSCDYIMAQLSGQPLSGKVVLEANINGYFFPLYAFSAAAERLFVYSSGQI
ncbi:MAG: hypothetical protein MSH10_00310 [Pygmaiobacter massiliensis]|nr:hypothetical protein [Pygmaiobacter massiliensis]